jgi:hypothetical protein
VLDAGIRTMTGEPPKTWDSWTARLPRFADPELGQYMAKVAAAMDDRQRRIGQHAAQERPLWATQALGQVPADRHLWPNGAATPSSSRPSRRSRPPTPYLSARPNERLKPDTAVVHPER